MRHRDGSRSGVAVIIVLGVLSLMMMMAVAFSITMRIERRSAGNYSHQVGTKNLVWAALARAVAAIDDSMTNSTPIDVFPKWDVLWSSNGITRVALGRGEALDHIPGALNRLAEGTVSTWNDMGSGSDTMGRYAYLVLNCSDFLDANFVGGEVRGGGTNVNEIQIANFPSMGDPVLFARDREKDVRYETLEELVVLNDEVQSFPEYFVTYSRFPYDDNLISLAGTTSELETRRDKIVPQLNSVVYKGDGTFIFNSLLDYIDTDNVPNALPDALGTPLVERVPMINEVWVDRVSVERKVDSCKISQPRFKVEGAYPFVEPSADSFEVELSVDVTVVDTNGAPVFAPKVTSGKEVVGTASLHNTAVFDRSIEGSVFPVTVAVTNTVGLNLLLEMKCKVLITSDGDQVVDAAPYPDTAVGFKFVIPIVPGIYGRTRLAATPSWECTDPRFNWDVPDGSGGRGDQWRNDSGTNTEDSINIAASLYFADKTRSEGYDTNLQMRVSNRGTLFSVGELGNLLRENDARRGRFRTVRLLNMGAGVNALRDKLMESFTIETNSVGRGLININSVERDIIEAGFLNVPLGYPEATVRITTEASGIASNIVANGPYTNVAEILDADWTTYPGLDVESLTELERESIIAHSYNLLAVRQNLFTIVVAASPSTSAMGTYADATAQVQSLGEKRALVQLWRDPFPNDDGKHECFVQFFKWLED